MQPTLLLDIRYGNRGHDIPPLDQPE